MKERKHERKRGRKCCKRKEGFEEGRKKVVEEGKVGRKEEEVERQEA
jgi:hypothetical protein